MFRLFDKFGLMVFPSADTHMRVENGETKVCIFAESHPEILVPSVDEFNVTRMVSLTTFSFLFGFEDIDNDRGALSVYSLYDRSAKSRLIRERNLVFPNFVNVANKIIKRGFTLVYFGGRNEG